ncbi:DUF4397 domain-containing protein [Ferruginibacter sp.]
MIKNIILFSSVAIVAFSSCKKEASEVTSGAVETSVSLTNANGSAKTVNFFVNGTQVNQVASVAANGTITGTYIGLGTSSTSNTLSVKDATATTTEYYSGTLTTEVGKAYTFIAYDTLISGKFKGILLSSDRTVPTDNVSTANVRFLNLSPKSPSMDLVMVRSIGSVATDSVTISGLPYLGSVATPDVAALSKFTSIKSSEVAGSISATSAATTYVIRLKLTGVGTIVSSTAATSIIPGRNYTIFARGTYPSSAVTLLLNN